MFFFTRYPSSHLLKAYFPDVQVKSSHWASASAKLQCPVLGQDAVWISTNYFGLGSVGIWIFKPLNCRNTQKHMWREKWGERETLVKGIFDLVFCLCWGHHEKERLYVKSRTLSNWHSNCCVSNGVKVHTEQGKSSSDGWNQALPVSVVSEGLLYRGCWVRAVNT